MFPTRWFEALLCCVGLAVAIGGASCGDLKKKRPDSNAAGAEAADAGEGSGGSGAEASPAAAGASGANDSSYAGQATDGATCLPGLTRCHGQLGFQRCKPDGVWGESQSCGGYSENGTSSYCALVTSGEEPWAACVDPACWWWIESGLGGKSDDDSAGVCVGTDQIRPCDADGILRRAVPCEGTCRVVGELDGRSLGYCDRECQPGERTCLVGPLSRECEAGAWSTQTQTCEDGATCQPLATGNLADIKCGGPCEPGTSRCSADNGSVEECTQQSEWEAPRSCLLGRCVRMGAQAQCQTECAPGQHLCAFDGDDAQVTCSETGLWGDPVACELGTTCRMGTSGALGCLACVGGDVMGGNVWGVADSRCDGAAVAACGGDNQYQAPEPCGDGLSCVEAVRGASVLAYCE